METRKSHDRRVREGWFDRYVVAPVIDLGASDDPLTPDARVWDVQFGDGDATFMAGVPDDFYATVYASHLLEHVVDPVAALRSWWRILRPGGFLLLLLPHRDLYEQQLTLPSRFNPDHKTFWLPFHGEAPDTLGLLPTIKQALPDGEVKIVRVLDDGWRPWVGQTEAEFSIEAVVRKPGDYASTGSTS